MQKVIKITKVILPLHATNSSTENGVLARALIIRMPVRPLVDGALWEERELATWAIAKKISYISRKYPDSLQLDNP